jgi:hypothetical protein
MYGISCQPNDLLVCKSGSGIDATSCGSGNNQIMTTKLVVAVIVSPGKNFPLASTATLATTAGKTDEAANLNNDPIFVSHTPTPATAANEFDDQLTWITVGELVGKIIASGKLP